MRPLAVLVCSPHAAAALRGLPSPGLLRKQAMHGTCNAGTPPTIQNFHVLVPHVSPFRHCNYSPCVRHFRLLAVWAISAPCLHLSLTHTSHHADGQDRHCAAIQGHAPQCCRLQGVCTVCRRRSHCDVVGHAQPAPSSQDYNFRSYALRRVKEEWQTASTVSAADATERLAMVSASSLPTLQAARVIRLARPLHRLWSRPACCSGRA